MPHTNLMDSTISKITRRLLPFLLLMYILSFLDRANLGFAKTSFQIDTGISDAMFAFGAGIFFLGYSLFEIPSNLIMHRVGARIWMCRIMVTWGIISSAMMFAHSETIFYVLRFLLGVAEAGFFPGVILYVTYWFPANRRGRALGLFYFGAPLAFIFGGPLSGLLLDMDGVAGLKGWQWMFLIEGIMATIVGVWAFWYLDDKPADAKWLSSEERNLIQNTIDAEESIKHHHGPKSVIKTLANPAVLYLCLIYFLIQASVYGVVYYVPTQVANLMGQEIGLQVGIVTAVPWICAFIAAWWVPRFSDIMGERRIIPSIVLALGAFGIAGSAASGLPLIALLSLCFAAAGLISVQPIFWTFPTGYLAGSSAAGGIAMINAIGALGAFVAPNAKIWAETYFHSEAAGLYVLSAFALLGAILIIGINRLGITGQVQLKNNSQNAKI